MLKNSILNISASLSSSRTRERNDALARLEDINFASAACLDGLDRNSVQLLLDGLSQFISLDKIAYAKSNSNVQLEIRLSKASSILRSLILNMLRKPKFFTAFKPKQNEKILGILTSNLTFEPANSKESKIFDPVALNCAKTLSLLLKTQDFKDHLFKSTYESILSAILTGLELLTSKSEAKKLNGNENLIIELFSIFYQFLNPQSTSTLILLNNKNSGLSDDPYYSRIFKIIRNYSINIFSDTKRERESIIHVFMIFNKCLIDLANVNIKLCHRIYRLGTYLILESKSISFQKLITEISIFINLIPPFISMNKLPRLVGDNWNIGPSGELINVSTSSIETDTTTTTTTLNARSVVSDKIGNTINASSEAEESFAISESDDHFNTLEKKVNLKRKSFKNTPDTERSKELSKMIEILFDLLHTRLNSKQLNMSDNSVGVSLFPNTDISKYGWFHTRYIYLNRGENATAWLMRLGVAKLLEAFYNLKAELNNLVDTDTEIFSLKRRKLPGIEIGFSYQISDFLENSANILDFFLSFLTNDKLIDNDALIVKFQIFILYLASISSSLSLKSSYMAIRQIHINCNSIFSQVLNFFENQDSTLNIWNLICVKLLHAIITDLSIFNVNARLSTKYLNKLLRYSLEFLKDTKMVKLSCNLLSYIAISDLSFPESTANLDKSIIRQYETIIDLSEISGPSVICKESVFFWICNLKLCKNFKFKNVKFTRSLNLNDSQLFSHKVINWFFSKSSQVSEINNSADIYAINVLVFWLCGAEHIQLSPCCTNKLEDSYNGHLVDFDYDWKSKLGLTEYILMQKVSDKEKIIVKSISEAICGSLIIGEIVSDRLMKFFMKLIENHYTNNVTSNLLPCWFVSVCICLAEEKINKFEDFLNKTKLLLLDKLHFKLLGSNQDCSFLTNFIKLVNQIPFEKQEWIIQVKDCFPDEKFLEKMVVQLNTTNEIGLVADEDSQLLDFFLPDPDDTVEKDTNLNAEVYNYRRLLRIPTLEQEVVKFCLLFLHSDKDVNIAVENAVSFAISLKSEYRILASYLELLTYFEKYDIFTLKEKTLDLVLNKLTLLLEKYTTKTYELTILVLCKIYGRFCHIYLFLDNSDIRTDCFSVYSYLRGLFEKGMLHSEYSLIEFCRFNLKLFENLDEYSTDFPYLEIFDNCLSSFTEMNNYSKYFITKSVSDLIKNSKLDKLDLYIKFLKSFSTPHESVEGSATFNCFMTLVSTSSETLIIATICNLLELSQYNQIKVYLPYSISEICRLNNIDDPKRLFWNLKEIFFKNWRSFELPISRFPFDLFGYENFTDFITMNYKELTALGLAYKDTSSIMNTARSTGTTEKSIVKDSMSLAIALAWTRDGIQYKAFELLRSYFSSSSMFKASLKEQFVLIIFQLLRFCDCSSEQSLLESCETPFDTDLVPSPILSVSVNIDLFLEYGINLKPTECVRLINYLSELCGITNLWSVPKVYFLCTRILALLESSIINIERSIHLRRLKFLFILAPKTFFNANICCTIINRLSVYLLQRDILPDVSRIIYCMIQCDGAISAERVISTWIPLFVNILQVRYCNDKEFQNLINFMDDYIQKLPQMESFLYILNPCMDVLMERKSTFSFELAVKIINSSMTVSESRHYIQVLSLLFELDDQNSYWDISSYIAHLTPNFIQTLYEIQTRFKDILSDSFKLWIGCCIGQYYSSTGKYPVVENYEFDKSIFDSYDRLKFGLEVNRLDTIFNIIISHLPNASLRSRLCFETLSGVIINKKILNKENISSFISYSELFSPLEEYIYPMSNYVSSLSVSAFEINNHTYYNETLESALNGFGTVICSSSFDVWLTKIVFSLIKELNTYTSIVTLLANYICQLPEFAAKCFCPLILYFIQSEQLKRGLLIARMIKEFFDQNLNHLEKPSINLFIELVLLIRIGAKNSNEKFISVFRIVDFKKIFNAALFINKPKAALMLMEDYYSSLPDVQPEVWINNQDTKDFMRKVYEKIDESDLIFGLPIDPKLEYGLNIIRNNGTKWSEVMFENAKFEAGLMIGGCEDDSSLNELTCGVLKMGWSGVSRVLGDYSTDHVDSKDNKIDKDLFYEKLWKLNQWDIPAPLGTVSENEAIYKVLREVKASPTESQRICSDIIKSLVSSQSSFLEKGTRVDCWIRTLAIITNIKDVFNYKASTINKLQSKFEKISSWFTDSDLKEFENLLLCRKAVFELMGSTQEQSTNSEVFKLSSNTCWYSVVNELHRYNHLMTLKCETQKAINSAVYLNKVSATKFNNLDVFVERVAKYDLALAFWAEHSETTFPVTTLKNIIEEDKKYGAISSSDFYGFPDVSTEFITATLTKWCYESRQETPANIVEQYIEPTINHIRTADKAVSNLGETYHIFAEFCDNQLRCGSLDATIYKLMDSTLHMEKDIKELKKFLESEHTEQRKDAKAAFMRIKTRYKMEQKELNSAMEGKKGYIIKAISFYLKSIALDDDESNAGDMDRFCALWLENSNLPLNESQLLSLPFFKFVPWINQLTSRLFNEESHFQSILQKLIISITLMHPFHSLYMLKSLCITKDDSEDAAAISRGKASETIWLQLNHRKDEFNVEGFTNLLGTMDSFCEHALQVTNTVVKHHKRIALSKIQNGAWWLQELPLLKFPSPVSVITVHKISKYNANKLPTIVKLDTSLAVAASGVSHPKILKMLLSTGETQKMLLKGSDDLRQDAIMEQVFDKVNHLLSKDNETRRRRLRIRTYKVVPLGPTSGMIEFVSNSMALIEILKPLHQGDKLTISEARNKMKEVQTQSSHVRIAVYKDIVKQIQPNMRTFFFNNFVSSDKWFDSRLVFAHGIATTSITGYVLGLGDRHCNNILIDKATGEPIHIDLGVAFDQGKALPIPETVPFRLTRDIIDGLGITGVSGTFSKSCEHVLRVLRSNTQYICGILDVLKYDPLYSWTVSPLRKKRLQAMYNNEGNQVFEKALKEDRGSEASAAIDTVKKKLEAKGLSNEAMVRELIREATDENNLGVIFLGWCPFL